MCGVWHFCPTLEVLALLRSALRFGNGETRFLCVARVLGVMEGKTERAARCSTVYSSAVWRGAAFAGGIDETCVQSSLSVLVLWCQVVGWLGRRWAAFLGGGCRDRSGCPPVCVPESTCVRAHVGMPEVPEVSDKQGVPLRPPPPPCSNKRVASKNAARPPSDGGCRSTGIGERSANMKRGNQGKQRMSDAGIEMERTSRSRRCQQVAWPRGLGSESITTYTP